MVRTPAGPGGLQPSGDRFVYCVQRIVPGDGAVLALDEIMRRGWIISAALAVGLCGTARAVRAADERPQTLAEAKAKEQIQSLAEVATLPILTAAGPTDVVQLFVHDNDPVLSSKLPPTEQAVVRAPGPGGLSTVRLTR